MIVDEPSLGLAPELTDELYDVIASIAASGTTVVLADQYEDRVVRIASVIYQLELGEVAFAGEASELVTGSTPAEER